ncbi:MAG: hypothetical protein ACOVO2_13095 [Emticicia sp.]|uniref:hypothetical protein n=1 Tax=Emticicia sp. TaxID=1930953 RepID=UPI003BA7DA0A
MKLRFFACLWLSVASLQSYAQGFAMNKLPIDNWELGNWKQVEQVDNPFKKKAGITAGNKLLYANTPGKITSKLTTADAKIKFDFMLGLNSESIFYVQGKHGILLSNTRPSGAIITKDGSLKLPAQNAGRSTGLWQTLELTFSEASFGNAVVLEKVTLNDVVIHQGYVLTSEGKNEGPIVFENKTGVIAISNVEYLKYNKETPLKLSNLNYELYETFDWDKQFAKKKDTPNDSGKATDLTKDYGVGFNRYLLVFKGDLDVEKDGNYSLIADCAGKESVTVDGKEILPMTDESYRKPRIAYLDLKKGKHAIEVKYIKVWWKAELGLFAAGPEIRPYALHAETSLPTPQAVGEIDIQPKNDVEMVRSFVMFNGKKRVHAISIGTPQGQHYSYDLDQAALLYAWKGEFADVTEMFHERGEPQLLEAKGVRTKFSGKPSVAILSDLNAPMPDSLDAYKELIYKGYSLDASGLPTYKFQLNGANITQKISPDADGIAVSVSANGGSNLYYKLAEGKAISLIEKGRYLVDNQYVLVDPKAKPIIRSSKSGQEMIMPLTGTINYSISW